MIGVGVSEGCKNDAQAIARHFEEHEDQLGFVVRVTILGHVVRGAAPTARDRLIATRMGVAAVDTLAAGDHGVLVGIDGNEICRTPLAVVSERKKKLNLEWVQLARILAQ